MVQQLGNLCCEPAAAVVAMRSSGSNQADPQHNLRIGSSSRILLDLVVIVGPTLQSYILE